MRRWWKRTKPVQKPTEFFIDFRAGADGQPPVIGGFIRCATQAEVDTELALFSARGIKTHVTEKVKR